MIPGINNIYKDGRFGMPRLHMQAIMQTAEYSNIVIGIRPVSKFALSFIENGCPTKPFAVKNKSANMGIAAGLIVINPEYCQAPELEYQKYKNQLADAFESDADLKPITLNISKKRISELKKYFGDALVIQQKNINTLLISWQKKGKTIQVIAKKINDNDYSLFDQTDSPLQVLGKTIVTHRDASCTKPITSDYDLLVICPTYNDHKPGGKDKTPFCTQCPIQDTRSMIQSIEDAKGGNWSERTREVATLINENIANLDVMRKGINLEIIQHNNEFHNPFASDLIHNLPCLIALPRAMDLSSITHSFEANNQTIVLIETKKELQKLCEIVRHNKYYWPTHAKYYDLFNAATKSTSLHTHSYAQQ